jgi:hypothetical protein
VYSFMSVIFHLCWCRLLTQSLQSDFGLQPEGLQRILFYFSLC